MNSYLDNIADCIKMEVESYTVAPSELTDTVQSTVQLPPDNFFHISPGSYADLTQVDHKKVFACANCSDMRRKIYEIDHLIYVGSPTCWAMTKVTKVRNLLTANVILTDIRARIVETLRPTEDKGKEEVDVTNVTNVTNVKDALYLNDYIYIIVFNEESDYFVDGTFDSAETFYQYMVFADRYMLNIPYICSKIEATFWLIGVRERQKDLWRANSILLTNTEQKYYSKRKFDVPAVVAPEPYPTGNTAAPKAVHMKQITRDKFITQENLHALFEILLKNNASEFANKILSIVGTSIMYCDMIMDSNIIPLVKSLKPFQNVIFYAMRILYLEELSMYNRKISAGRFILDIDAVSTLPIFTGRNGSSPGLSTPYIPTIAKSVSHSPKSLLIPIYFPGTRCVVSLADFKERFTTYTDGMLNGIPWSNVDVANSAQIPDPLNTDVVIPTFKVAFNGSGICACAIRNPLEAAFDSYIEYLEEYYPSRKFVLKTAKHAVRDDTLFEVDSDSDHEDNIQADAPVTRNSSYDFADIDLMVECNFDDFAAVAGIIFARIKENVKSVNLNCELVKTETENKYKYVVEGLNRTIDIFHVDNIPAVIVKYHLPCVRAWYNGKTVKMFPSFVTAAMTSLNIDIRWTSNRKDLRDTVLKYFQRGFAMLLNSSDRSSLIEYINDGNDDGTSKWPKHIPPANVGRWELMRWEKRLLFEDCYLMLLNPSVCRIGIHQNIPTKANRANLEMFHLTKRSRRGQSNKLRQEYKAKNGNVILPCNCPIISDYM